MHTAVHKRRRVLIVLSWAIALGPTLVHAQTYPRLSRSDLKTLQQSFASVADEVLPSVVAIRCPATSSPESPNHWPQRLSWRHCVLAHAGSTPSGSAQSGQRWVAGSAASMAACTAGAVVASAAAVGNRCRP